MTVYIALYWQFILAYIIGGAVYSVLKWCIELYRLRQTVLAIDLANKPANSVYSDEAWIDKQKTEAANRRFDSYAYPPRASDNKGTLFVWAVFWPLNLVWTLVADVAREAWGWLYRKFGAIYDRIAKAILPE